MKDAAPASMGNRNRLYLGLNDIEMSDAAREVKRGYITSCREVDVQRETTGADAGDGRVHDVQVGWSARRRLRQIVDANVLVAG